MQRGRYETTVQVPSSLPRGDYQLLARAIGNEQYAESWSDPDVTIYSETGLQLSGPGQATIDTQAIFQGKFLDDSGAGVASLPLQVTIDGQAIPSQLTGPSGEFSFTHIFAEPGRHEVEVKFEGADLLLGSSVRLELTAVMPTVLNVASPGLVKVGESFTVKGTLENIRGEPLPGEEVSISIASGPSQTVASGADGEFTASGIVEGFGDVDVRVEYAGNILLLPSSQAVRGVARDLTILSLSGPGIIPLGESATFYGSITSETLTSIGAREVEIEDGNGNQLGTVTSDAQGSFLYQTAPLTTPGPHTVFARFDEQDFLTSGSATFSYTVVGPTVLTIAGTQLARSGQTVGLQGTLQSSGGQPVPGVPIWVGESGGPTIITDDEGNFSWELLVEAEPNQSDIETLINVPFGFDGTDRLAPAIGKYVITVEIPRLTVSEPEPAVRGETATIRGSVFLANRPLPDAVLTMEPDIRAATSPTGAFALSYPVSEEAPLGSNAFVVTPPELNLESEVAINVKSVSQLTVVPADEVRPGMEVQLTATLTDDSGNGIVNATLRTGQGVAASTDEDGLALVPLTVPEDSEELAAVVTFTGLCAFQAA